MQNKEVQIYKNVSFYSWAAGIFDIYGAMTFSRMTIRIKDFFILVLGYLNEMNIHDI
jgi:hypothetical protein